MSADGQKWSLYRFVKRAVVFLTFFTLLPVAAQQAGITGRGVGITLLIAVPIASGLMSCLVALLAAKADDIEVPAGLLAALLSGAVFSVITFVATLNGAIRLVDTEGLDDSLVRFLKHDAPGLWALAALADAIAFAHCVSRKIEDLAHKADEPPPANRLGEE